MCAFKPSYGALRLHYCTTRAINASTETFSPRSLWLFPPHPRPPYRSNLSVQQQSCLITAALTHLLSSLPCHLVAGGGEKNEKKGKRRTTGWLRTTTPYRTAWRFNIERCIGESSGRVSPTWQRCDGESAASKPRAEQRYESAPPLPITQRHASPSESERQLPTGNSRNVVTPSIVAP